MDELEKLKQENQELKDALLYIAETAYDILLQNPIRDLDERLTYAEHLTGQKVPKNRR